MKCNVVYYLGDAYPQGMAGTKRVQHLIDGLSEHGNVRQRVIVSRQQRSTFHNEASGVFRGVEYKTVAYNVSKYVYGLFWLWYLIRHCRELLISKDRALKNVLYVYGRLDPRNAAQIIFSKIIGYRLVFDVVEDDNEGLKIAASFSRRMGFLLYKLCSNPMCRMADGFLVITSYLYKKMINQAGKDKPILLRSISVDFNIINFGMENNLSKVSMFYSGSFGEKESIKMLFEAFTLLASKYPELYLVLCGRPIKARATEVSKLINESAFRSRITFHGYLSDEEYYKILQSIHIPCVIRDRSAYASAGFPFKVGEYLAAGKVAVLSDVSELREFVKHQQDCYLYEPENQMDFVAKVECAIEMVLSHGSMGERAVQTARRCFDRTKQAELFYSFLDAI